MKHEDEALSALKYVVCYYAELLEMILLGLDNQTLLLSQRVSQKFFNVIKNSKKVQMKLFFVQPTREEALKLLPIDNDSWVFSRNPRSYTIMNPLIFTFGAWREKHYRDTIRMRRSILQSAPSSRRECSSWRRMFAQAKCEQDDDHCLFDDQDITISDSPLKTMMGRVEVEMFDPISGEFHRLQLLVRFFQCARLLDEAQNVQEALRRSRKGGRGWPADFAMGGR